MLPIKHTVVSVFLDLHAVVYFMAPDEYLRAEGHKYSCQNENSVLSSHILAQYSITE